MFIVHVALQGCLRADAVDYGLTPDTGGHIRYVLELCAANERAGVDRQIIVTRRFEDEKLGSDYARREEQVSERVSILRIDGKTLDYLPKEELWRENEALSDSLVEGIEAMERRPDILHAHYADAGATATRVKERLGIPFVFTSHSLGRAKAKTLPPSARDGLSKRIAIEEEAIARADRIIASSRDEAEHQYAAYEQNVPEKVTLNPPGCDLAAFAAGGAREEAGERVEEAVGHFLDDPDKPPILALARPVRKKNLGALVHAFASSPALRDQANLVIFAGVRDDLQDLDEEGREVVQRLLYLVDRYDLYGKVALPKRHRPDEVPAIFRWAAERRGIFANPAKSEPFGLTLLEAAASGLPVIATRCGGPHDIVGRLGNGRLVDPHSPEDIASAANELLADRELWERCRDAGRDRVRYYCWDRHAREYLADLEGLLRPRTPLAMTVKRDRLIVSDIDDTLIGEKASLAAFAKWKEQNRGFHFAIATGRSLQDAIRILRDWDAPLPEVLITSVGSEIYYSDDLDLRQLRADREWEAHIGEGWDAAAVEAVVGRFPEISSQAPCEQRPHKRSYFIEDPATVRELGNALAAEGLEATIVHSHERYLDVMPKRASKGQALSWLARRLGLPLSATLAAGDSGNDADLLLTAGTGVVVANHRPELDRLRVHPNAYFAKGAFAAGLLEALNRKVA